MSAATAASAGPSTGPDTSPAPSPPAIEACPLCGGPLGGEQEWCLRCGAAARTRLASTPHWRTPVIALGLAIVLGLGALTAALVSLAGGPGTLTPTTITRTVTMPASVPSTTTTMPATTTPTTPPATTTPTTTLATTTPGALTPTVGGHTATIPSILLPHTKR